jgi:hypothetical protein
MAAFPTAVATKEKPRRRHQDPLTNHSDNGAEIKAISNRTPKGDYTGISTLMVPSLGMMSILMMEIEGVFDFEPQTAERVLTLYFICVLWFA